MVIEKEMKLWFLLALLCYGFGNANGRSLADLETFNVINFGARADGVTDNSQAFLAAWKAACTSTGAVNLVIPSGTYFLNPVQFRGPCKNVQSLTVQMQGTLKASTDLNQYATARVWVEFGWVDHLTLTGGGTFDGQGEVTWPLNTCPRDQNCKIPPTSLMFVNMNNTIVNHIKSVNSKFFHIGVLGCQNFQGSRIQITAPAESPNTDGIHLERNSGVTISDSEIATGDDCVSVGQGNSLVTLNGIRCGPGHGISVGSLGKYQNEKDVRGLIVRDCSLTETDNGIRIKTWANSPTSSVCANMTFENIVMNNVANPIIIDQSYCPYANCMSSASSKVKISDIHFRNITGTSKTPVAVTLKCSQRVPCEKVSLQDVDLTFTGQNSTSATCLNVKADYSGTQNPPPCQ
uniref:Exopolygalacturonase n=1 Tax=Elaeis guineensis var. tenera TaxID=51953 RepID=A0A6I9QVC1_ELAGV|nr:exopolygalacturonase [Elaeis guineensis]